MNRYTAFVEWTTVGIRTVEEIEVPARSALEARRAALAKLAEGYDPGGRLLWVICRREGIFSLFVN
jgi:hypothetical protein